MYNPTRELNILDLVFTNEQDMVENLIVTHPISNTDHNTIMFSLRLSDVVKAAGADEKVNMHDYHKGNYVEMNKALNSVEWEEHFEGISTNCKWEFFKEQLTLNKIKYIPIGIIKKKKYPP